MLHASNRRMQNHILGLAELIFASTTNALAATTVPPTSPMKDFCASIAHAANVLWILKECIRSQKKSTSSYLNLLFQAGGFVVITPANSPLQTILGALIVLRRMVCASGTLACYALRS